MVLAGIGLRAGVLTVVVSLVSCATPQATTERLRMQTDMAAAAKAASDCDDKLASTLRFAPIYAKLCLGPLPTPLAMVADGERYSAAMISLGLQWYAEKQKCDQRMFEGFARVSAELAAIAVAWAQESAQILQKAVTERPAYGEVNREIGALAYRQRSDIRTWDARTKARLDLRQSADDVQTQQAAAAGGRALQFALNALVERQRALATLQQSIVAKDAEPLPVSEIVPTSCRYTGINPPCLACGP